MWIYYETDGDAGWYNVRLFSTEHLANQYRLHRQSAYAHVAEIEVDKEVVKVPIEDVLCPDCNGPMVSRKGQYGTFWGCKAYPSCKGTRDSMGRSKAERAAERNRDNDEEAPVSRTLENDKFRFRKS